MPSDFGRAVGWGAGVYLGIVLMIVLLTVVLPLLFCTGLVGGCALLGTAAAPAMREAAEKAERERQQAERRAAREQAAEPAVVLDPATPAARIEPKPVTPLPEPEENPVNLTNFTAIETGMTLSQVYELLGDRCEVLSENEIAGIRTQMLQWKVGGYSPGNCNVMFQQGRVIQKAQAFLPQGKARAAKAEPPTPPAVDPLPTIPSEAPPPPKPELRKWTSADGAFSVEAEFVSQIGPRIKLRKADGSEITVQRDQLSPDDQTWIGNWAKRGR